ncbi:MAG: Hsp20/alpha crystallin family protein [Sedimentisphaerales bacterium]|nr:Hsp20/alpha crystallin family protein [Sedimentisphaerales bacterium]
MSEKELAKKQQAEVTRREQTEEVFVPAADIWETEDQIMIRMDMPGVAKNDTEVKIERDTLLVQGKVSSEAQGNLLYGEQRVGNFRREFSLSDDLDHEHVSAQMNDGILTITIGKAEAVKPRKIEILAAS